MKSDPNFSAAAQCSELEKLVGRRINPGVSLAEQQERFSFLKNAPVEHEYTAGVKVGLVEPASDEGPRSREFLGVYFRRRDAPNHAARKCHPFVRFPFPFPLLLLSRLVSSA